MIANGDKYTMTMPTDSDDFPWLVIQRVNSGTQVANPDAPFTIETFEGMSDASARFAAITSDFHPMMLTASDGKIVVISRRNALPHPHAAAH